jgi:hypothetical protein
VRAARAWDGVVRREDAMVVGGGRCVPAAWAWGRRGGGLVSGGLPPVGGAGCGPRFWWWEESKGGKRVRRCESGVGLCRWFRGDKEMDYGPIGISEFGCKYVVQKLVSKGLFNSQDLRTHN